LNTEQGIKEVKDRHSRTLFSFPGVVGVGVEQDDTGKFVLTLHVATDDPEVLDQLPKEVEGYRVKIIRSGPYRKF
jgi:hypothetical protein